MNRKGIWLDRLLYLPTTSAEEESRTPMTLRPLAPEASASANSATSAIVKNYLLFSERRKVA
jgi:hypothetical protein